MNDGRAERDMREERDAHDVRGVQDEQGEKGAAADVRDAARDAGADERDLGTAGPSGGSGGPGGPGRRGPGTGGPPDDGEGPDEPGDHGPDSGSGTPGADDDLGADDLGADELALRRLLKQAVQDVSPRPDSLDHLRRAVPARRARKKQALVGLAATAVLLIVAVPALVHVSTSGGSGVDRTSVAGHGEDAHGGTGGGRDVDGGRQGPGQPPGTSGAADGDGRHGKGDGSTPGSGPTSPDPDRTLSATAPDCVASALGDAQAGVGAPDADGRVYGTFRVANVSGSECTVDGAGTIVAVAQGSADPARITVVDHTVGDPATGLPSPAQELGRLILKPGTAYEVRFAWVPSDSCPSGGSSGGDGGATPGPTPSEGTGSGGKPEGTDQSGVGPQLVRQEGEPVGGSGSVSVSHTAEPGAPTAATTISNACAGTLYRTGLLPGA